MVWAEIEWCTGGRHSHLGTANPECKNALMTKTILRSGISLFCCCRSVGSALCCVRQHIQWKPGQFFATPTDKLKQRFSLLVFVFFCGTFDFFSSESGKYGQWIHHNPNARKLAGFNCSGILVVVLRSTQAHGCKEVRQATGWRKIA